MTELMKRYEEETGQTLEEAGERGITLNFYLKYIQWLETKAEAYDRLMSGGKKTLKEWANMFGCPIAIDSNGWAYLYEKVPVIEYGDWCNPSGKTVFFGKVSPSYIDFSGDWKDSLTLPDGWEEA